MSTPDHRDRIAAALNGRSQRTLDDPSATSLFLGEKAATANREALDHAKKLEKKGYDRDMIWDDTRIKYGQPWWKDGKRWRFETQTPPTVTPPKAYGDHSVSSVVSDPEAEAAYPALKKDVLRYSPDIKSGPDKGAAYASSAGRIGLGPEEANGSRLPFTMQHERQHRIDQIEGVDDIGAGYDWKVPHTKRPAEMRASHAAARDMYMTKEQKQTIPPWRTELPHESMYGSRRSFYDAAMIKDPEVERERAEWDKQNNDFAAREREKWARKVSAEPTQSLQAMLDAFVAWGARSKGASARSRADNDAKIDFLKQELLRREGLNTQ